MSEKFRHQEYTELTEMFSEVLEKIRITGRYTWPEIHTAWAAAVSEKTLVSLEKQGKIKFVAP